jgi:hypothetical protein
VRVTVLGTPPAIFVGRARADVERIVFRFPNGDEAEVRPDERGYVFEPATALRTRSPIFSELIGYDGQGKELVHERLQPPG